MWIPFRQDVVETIQAMPQLARDLCVQLKEIGDNPSSLGTTGSGEPGLFGQVGWTVAMGSALDLVLQEAQRAVLPWPLHSELDGCQKRWRRVLISVEHLAKPVAVRDYEVCVQDTKRTLDFPPDSPDELEYLLDNLDVYHLLVAGVDGLWPDFRLSAQFESPLASVRELLIDTLLPRVLADGGWHVPGSVFNPFVHDDLNEFTYPWLPESFWWRHLPDLV